MFLLGALVAAGVAVVAGALFLAVVLPVRRQRQANQVVPGVPTRAPRAWAGAHSPEAKLHRRLRDVVVALRSLPMSGSFVTDGRLTVERYALTLDERLIAVAALPEAVRAEPLAKVTADVEQLEVSVGELVSQVAAGSVGHEQAFRELSEDLAHFREARAEVEALETASPGDQIPEMPDPPEQVAQPHSPEASPTGDDQ